MSKSKQNAKSGKVSKVEYFDLDIFVNKYIWLVLPLLMITYYIYSMSSDGFYGDDEIGYLMNLKYSFDSYGAWLGNSAKTGYRILFYLPSILGINFLRISHIILTSVTVICVYYLGRELKIKNSSVISLLFAIQPFVIQFSFRAWPEILTGSLISLSLLFYYKEKYIFSSLVSTYVFTVRQEYGVILFLTYGVVYALPVVKYYSDKSTSKTDSNNRSSFIYLLSNSLIPLLILCLAPILLSLIAFFYTGDLLWIIKDMKTYAIDKAIAYRDFWHYFKTYILIIGPISFVFLIFGFFGYLNDRSKFKTYFKKYGLVFVIFLSGFLLFVLMSWKALNFGGGTGALRFLLPISPLAAIICGLGLKNVMSGIQKKYLYSILTFITIITYFFLSSKIDRSVGTGLKEYFQPDYLKFVFIVILFIVCFVLIEFKLNHKIFLAVLLLLGVGFTIIDEKPYRLDPEKQTVKMICDYWHKKGFDNKTTLCNHIFFYYSLGIAWGKSPQFQSLNKANLKSAPAGSICIWDKHYSFRSEYSTDVPISYLENNPDYKLLAVFHYSDNTLFASIFEKIGNDKN